MKLAGSAEIGADRQRVWAALRDPAVLVRTLPGCERLEETGPDTYRMTINAGVGSIKGVYQGEVALSDPLEPESFTLKARGQGAPGTVDATVLVRLSEAGAGTRVDYEAEAVVGGMIGGVGQRMLGSVAKRTAGEFFSAVEQHLTAPTTAEPAAEVAAAPAAAGASEAAGLPAAQGAVFERPARKHTETRPWVMLAAFGMGAGVALGGVTLGWLLGRGSRRRGA
ncbi:Carbon monoxide oxidation accessory protein CoxG [[Actinomadura] parvosata subsp. kistnae]|uniref:Carbon monoxide dehydrogenase n=1 Tax=[Actinomadura] parvosata subsp. kistnae TaxID=1909395 RepID=A0A1U9ZR23_9ACTN|nr:carbon monoxide dehydrogenase subunit G [Nonomuraea sp. ATCC 55076]AQZ60378.1 carbon monoxide dehydrogenase [Nonomuraea sp. ATCC 55076]SPL91101.1 Carbon monoxide oxidation accessory protein CoxG [Actinomadura parvosata subsp. kistnae]